MSRRSALSTFVVSTSVLAMTLPAQAAAPEFVDLTGFSKSRAQTYAAPYKVDRGGWGLDYRGMSNHDPAKSRVRRLSNVERAAFVAPTKDPGAKAIAYINHHARALGIENFQSGGLELVSAHNLSDGSAIVKLRQRVEGIEVFGPQLSLLINAKGELATVSGALHTQLRVLKGASQAFTRSPESVLRDVLGQETSRGVSPQRWLSRDAGGGYTVFDVDRLGRAKGFGDAVRTKQLWIPTAQGLEAAYFVEYAHNDGEGEQGVMVVARASDSQVLFQKGLTMADSFKYRVWVRDDARNTPLDNPLLDVTPNTTGKPDQVTVPAEHFPRRVVNIEGFNTNPEGKPDPWIPAGGTESKGNNVDAYTDSDQTKDADGKAVNDGFTDGDIRAKVNANGDFDYPYDFNVEPGATDDQKMAAITQIFYTINWLHDYWYDLGWDEKSGNAQMDNYGRGGDAKDKDPILAQVQDSANAGERNNANITVFADGTSPRMQMYLWTSKDKVRSLTASPAITDFKDETETANYGKQNFNVTAQAVLVEDPEAPVNDGCQAVADPSTVQGKIVIVKMGYEPGEPATCKSIQRAALLQEAGAVGMIFMDATERVPKLGGDWPTEVTLPALSVNKSNGDRLLTAMQNGPVQLTMKRTKGTEIDSSLDNQVVAHEWGHYAHLRQVKCGGIGCIGMSEGWADYFALHMSMKEGDDFNGVYPLAVYAGMSRNVDPFYFGLRRYPYSNKKTINPLMFHHIADESKDTLPDPADIPQQVSGQPMSEVHNAGEIWASVLMAVEHELHEANKSKSTPLDWDGVHRLMGEYMIAGMKLAPPQPTWTEQRDAMLAVARARDEKDFEAMAKGFAYRGMGTCAVSPAADSKDNNGAVSNEEITGKVAFEGWSLDDGQTSCDQDGVLDVNERGHLNVSLRNAGMAALKATKVEVRSKDDALVVDTTGPMTVDELAIDGTDTIKVPVRLVKAPKEGRTLPVEIILSDENSCLKTLQIDVKPRVDIDQVAESTDMEGFESDSKIWKVETIVDAGQPAWERISEKADDQGNYLWRGRDLSTISDTALVSPAFKAKADEDFTIEFEHAYNFEQSDNEGTMVNWDGALIEYSIDDGKNWLDLADVVVNPEFNGIISQIDDSKNPLTGRNGYVGTSPGYPARSLVRLNFQRNVAGKTVKIRFRIGTDAASGAPGWLIDNLKVQGVEKSPFTAVVPDACEAQDGETGSTGGGETGTGTGGTGGATTGGDATGGDSTGTGGPGQQKPEKLGCSCSTEGEQSGLVAGFALFALGLFRRRREKGLRS